MIKIILVASIVLFFIAIKNHVLTQAHVVKKVEKTWYDRIWSGSRPPKDNLTEDGLRYRKQSNICAIAGFCMLGIYLLLSSYSL